ncbi:MAG: pyridoxamine 5'-phosphate oxidase family protein [Anaerolineae bacterium]|nr:pyridoxamine 5'-phosphate oxidase family protein [Anaerolineae bacterium]
MTDQTTALRQLLSSQRFAVLATESMGQPYTSLMAFAASQDLRCLVLVTERATRKFGHMVANPRVALLVDDRTNAGTDTQSATAVTVLGHATEATDREKPTLLALFVTRHPTMADFATSPGCAVMRVRVDVYQIVTHFQDVTLHYPA